MSTDCAIQLRSSLTEYVSDTNPNICQFIAIFGFQGLCEIGVYGSHLTVKHLVIIKYVKTDVVLLADVFQTCRKTCIDAYKLDPLHYYIAPESTYCEYLVALLFLLYSIAIFCYKHCYFS